MKLLKKTCIVAAVIAIGSCGWYLFPSGGENASDAKGKVLRSRLIREQKVAKRQEIRIKTENHFQPAAKTKDAPSDEDVAKAGEGKDWNPFEDADSAKFDLSFNFEFDDEVGVSKDNISPVVRKAMDALASARASFDRKQILASVRNLLSLASSGAGVPAAARAAAIDALKMEGGGISESLAEMVELATDQNESISSAALEAMQELLWDFDTKPQQIADALAQMVKLTTDATIIEPFVYEMGNMEPQLRADTALMLLDSGNQAAITVLSDNMGFVFDDFEGEVQNREDIVAWGEKHKGESAAVASGLGD